MYDFDIDNFPENDPYGINIDVHPIYNALVITNSSDPNSSNSKKIVKVKNITVGTNIRHLATDIIDRCTDFLPPDKLPEIEQLLYYIQNRNETQPEPELDGSKNLNILSMDQNQNKNQNDEADMDDLHIYIEDLYEDIDRKTIAATKILSLARDPANLEHLLSSNTLLGALERVLRENWKKSTELATYIVYIFYCFSAFRQFHSVIMDHKIGTQCLTIVDFELQRTRKLIDEVENDPNKRNDNKLLEQINSIKANSDQLLRVTLYLLLNMAEDVRIQQRMKKRGINAILVECLAQNRSEEVLIMVVSFLKRLSLFLENVEEMKDLKIISKLDGPLSNINSKSKDVQNVTLRLLLNLSFHTDLRQDIHKELKILPKLVKWFQSKDPEISKTALCLLYQLSYDEKHRASYAYIENLIDSVIAEQLKNTEKDGDPEATATALLVNLCSNVACAGEIVKLHNGKVVKTMVKRAFKHKSVVLMKMIRNISQFEPAKELLINWVGDLTNNIKLSLARCYDKFMDADQKLLDQINKNMRGSSKKRAKDFSGDGHQVNSSDFQEEIEAFALECIGTLANLTNPDLDYNLLLQEFDIWEQLSKALDPTSKTPDDLVLEIIILIGTFCIDDNCAFTLSNQGLIPMLIELLKKKQEDDELVCQIVNVINRLITHEKTRAKVVNESQAAAYIVDLMHDSNEQIRNVCDKTLDLISEVSREWSDKIKLEKFSWHNQQWLEMMHNNKLGEAAAQSQMMGGGANDGYDEYAYTEPLDYLDDEEYYN